MVPDQCHIPFLTTLLVVTHYTKIILQDPIYIHAIEFYFLSE